VATSQTSAPIGRRAHAAWLLFGGVLTGVVLAGCALGSWVVLNGHDKRMAETQQQSYQHQANRIELDVESGDVILAAGPAGQVSVERRLEWSGPKPVVEESWQGDTLHIRAQCPRAGLTQLGMTRCSTAYALRVPDGVVVEASVRSGAIRANDLKGELRLSNLFGNIEIANASGRIQVRSDIGSIMATGLSCTEADVKTQQGDVNLHFAAPPELLKTGAVTGNVEVAVPPPGKDTDGYQIRADARHGDRHIGVPEDPAARHQLFATTDDGDVYVRYTGA
jgi:hypothetical protein